MKTTKILGMLMAFFCFIGLGACSNDDSEEILTMYVSAETGVYYGMVGAVEGLIVRIAPSQDWYAMSMGAIIGFEYEKGYEYKLLVGKTIVENPPADGSAIIYRLLEIQERKQVFSYDLPENFSMDDISFQTGCSADIYKIINPKMTVNAYGALNDGKASYTYGSWIFLEYALGEGDEFYGQNSLMAAYALIVDENGEAWLTNVGGLGIPIKGVLSESSFEGLRDGEPNRELTYRVILMNEIGHAIQEFSVTFRKE